MPGEVLWEGDTKYLNRGWNIYAPAAVQDLDGDGVSDFIIAHGGDPTVPAAVGDIVLFAVKCIARGDVCPRLTKDLS